MAPMLCELIPVHGICVLSILAAAENIEPCRILHDPKNRNWRSLHVGARPIISTWKRTSSEPDKNRLLNSFDAEIGIDSTFDNVRGAENLELRNNLICLTNIHLRSLHFRRLGTGSEPRASREGTDSWERTMIIYNKLG